MRLDNLLSAITSVSYPQIPNLPIYDVRNTAYAGGAKLDGVTDDYAAVAAALAAALAAGGGSVMISGPCAVSQEVSVPQRCGLIGPVANYGSANLGSGTFSGPYVIKPTVGASGLRSVVNLSGAGSFLGHLAVFANNQARAAVFTSGSYGVTIQNSVIWWGTEYGVWCQTQDVWINECKINQDNRGVGIFFDDAAPTGQAAADSRLAASHVSGGCGLYGNVWSRCGNVVFAMNHIYPGGSSGVEGAITGCTGNAVTPIKITKTAHGYTNGQVVYLRSVGGNTNANWTYTVQNKTANDFELASLQYGDLASGSPIITNLMDTSMWSVGFVPSTISVTGTGIPGGTTILSIDSPTQITLTANATITTAKGVASQGGSLLTINSIGNAAYTSGGVVALAGNSIGYHLQDTSYNRITAGSYVDGEKHPNMIDILISTTGNNSSRRNSIIGSQAHNDNETIPNTGYGGAGVGSKRAIVLRNYNSGGTISGTTIIGCDASGAPGGATLGFDALLDTKAVGSVFNTILIGCTARNTAALWTGAAPAVHWGNTYYTGNEVAGEAQGEFYVKRLAADFVLGAGTSAQAITGFNHPVGANETWWVEMEFWVSNSVGTGGVQMDVNGPTNTDVEIGFFGDTTVVTGFRSDRQTAVATMNGTALCAGITGVIQISVSIVTTAAGTIQPRIKNVTGTDTNTVLKGAVMKAWRVA